mgnify:CR=1 FL=1
MHDNTSKRQPNYAHPTPVTDLYNKHIIDVACGMVHTVCVASTGEVYSFGNNKCGQCGRYENESCSSINHQGAGAPGIIRKLLGKQIVGLACGAGHTCVIDNNGYAYSWGIGRSGMCTIIHLLRLSL